MCHLGDHARHGQDFYVPAQRSALLIGKDVAVLHLSSDAHRGEVEYAEHSGQISPGGVFREVVPVRLDDAGMNAAHRVQVTRFRIDLNRFGHAADEEVQLQKLQKTLVNHGMW